MVQRPHDLHLPPQVGGGGARVSAAARRQRAAQPCAQPALVGGAQLRRRGARGDRGRGASAAPYNGSAQLGPTGGSLRSRGGAAARCWDVCRQGRLAGAPARPLTRRVFTTLTAYSMSSPVFRHSLTLPKLPRPSVSITMYCTAGLSLNSLRWHTVAWCGRQQHTRCVLRTPGCSIKCSAAPNAFNKPAARGACGRLPHAGTLAGHLPLTI